MIFSATTSTLRGMLLGRLLVGTGMGLGPPVAALYVAEVYNINRAIFKIYQCYERLITFVLSPKISVSLFHDQASPTFVRGTYGSFTQIASCLGLLASLCIGIPAKDVLGW